jgi:enolase
MSRIKTILGRQLLDSRGLPTLEVEVITDSGFSGRALVPSGASTGEHEAYELRDNNKKIYQGKGVLKPLKNLQDKISPALVGASVCDQYNIDKLLIDLDGTAQKTNLGANTILGVSLACSRAGANVSGLPLYRYLGGAFTQVMPVPFMNVINGGVHANNALDIQEFMIVPHGFSSFSEGLRCGVEVYHTLKNLIDKKKLSTAVGDEGGFAPSLKSSHEALDLILTAIEKANYDPSTQVSLALDYAASSFFVDKKYNLKGEDKKLSQAQMLESIESLVEKYPIISVEDPLDENDWDGFSLLTKKMGSKLQVIGDDLFVTNSKRIQKGIKEGCANSILIKLNQIGTLSETLECIATAHKSGYKTMISHRSGETEDYFIADLAVACGSGQIKTGAPCRSERTSKYNQLLRIEEEMLGNVRFGF